MHTNNNDSNTINPATEVPPNPNDNTNMSDITGTSSPDAQAETAVGVIDPVKKLELEEKFHTIINTPRFWENPNRIKRLDEALVLPVYDDPSMRMFYDSAKDELTAEAMKFAIANQCIPVAPTEEQIKELAEVKYHDKYVLEPLRKAEREAKKKKKSA